MEFMQKKNNEIKSIETKFLCSYFGAMNDISRKMFKIIYIGVKSNLNWKICASEKTLCRVHRIQNKICGSVESS